MTLSVETIGIYNITKLPNGMYGVSLNNGNIGAFITDEAGLLRFKEKYVNKGDTFTSSNSGKRQMTYEEACRILYGGSNTWGLESLKLTNEAIDVILNREAKYIKEKVKDPKFLVSPALTVFSDPEVKEKMSDPKFLVSPALSIFS